LKEQTGHWKRL